MGKKNGSNYEKPPSKDHMAPPKQKYKAKNEIQHNILEKSVGYANPRPSVPEQAASQVKYKLPVQQSEYAPPPVRHQDSYYRNVPTNDAPAYGLMHVQQDGQGYAPPPIQQQAQGQYFHPNPNNGGYAPTAPKSYSEYGAPHRGPGPVVFDSNTQPQASAPPLSPRKSSLASPNSSGGSPTAYRIPSSPLSGSESVAQRKAPPIPPGTDIVSGGYASYTNTTSSEPAYASRELPASITNDSNVGYAKLDRNSQQRSQPVYASRKPPPVVPNGSNGYASLNKEPQSNYAHLPNHRPVPHPSEYAHLNQDLRNGGNDESMYANRRAPPPPPSEYAHLQRQGGGNFENELVYANKRAPPPPPSEYAKLSSNSSTNNGNASYGSQNNKATPSYDQLSTDTLQSQDTIYANSNRNDRYTSAPPIPQPTATFSNEDYDDVYRTGDGKLKIKEAVKTKSEPLPQPSAPPTQSQHRVVSVPPPLGSTGTQAPPSHLLQKRGIPPQVQEMVPPPYQRYPTFPMQGGQQNQGNQQFQNTPGATQGQPIAYTSTPSVYISPEQQIYPPQGMSIPQQIPQQIQQQMLPDQHMVPPGQIPFVRSASMHIRKSKSFGAEDKPNIIAKPRTTSTGRHPIKANLQHQSSIPVRGPSAPIYNGGSMPRGMRMPNMGSGDPRTMSLERDVKLSPQMPRVYRDGSASSGGVKVYNPKSKKVQKNNRPDDTRSMLSAMTLDSHHDDRQQWSYNGKFDYDDDHDNNMNEKFAGGEHYDFGQIPDDY